MKRNMNRTIIGRRPSILRPLLVLCVAASAGLGTAALGAQTSPAGATTVNSELDLAVASFDEAWRIVHETHFDTTFGGVDWNAVRAELRPQVLAASKPDEVRALIHEMLGRLELSCHVRHSEGMT